MPNNNKQEELRRLIKYGIISGEIDILRLIEETEDPVLLKIIKEISLERAVEESNNKLKKSN